MDTQFPTFRRIAAFRVPFRSLWPWRKTLAQRRSLLRLILTATEEGIPLSDLIDVWATDESGFQRDRLHRLAELLKSGTALADAVEQVPGVLGDDEILAIRFGVQSGMLAASIRDLLEQPQPAALARAPRWRKSLIYIALVTLVAFNVVMFLQIKIVPEFQQIFKEFDISITPALQWSVILSNFFANYWYLFVGAFMAIVWFLFSPWPGRQLRLAVLDRLFTWPRELRTADVLQKLSVATKAGRPIPGAISTLARYHFDPALRHRLLFVRNEMEQGADVWHSMATVGLLTPQDVYALSLAERVGNRSWVLHQLALLKKRRTLQRLAKWSEMALPLMVLILGAYVLFQAVGIFGSLIKIVYSLL